MFQSRLEIEPTATALAEHVFVRYLPESNFLGHLSSLLASSTLAIARERRYRGASVSPGSIAVLGQAGEGCGSRLSREEVMVYDRAVPDRAHVRMARTPRCVHRVARRLDERSHASPACNRMKFVHAAD